MSSDGGGGLECAICQVPRVPHEAGERSGDIRHAWSVDGQLQESELGGIKPVISKKGSSGQSLQIMVAPAPDVMLRNLLVQLGVVTNEQIMALGMPVTELKLPTKDS